MNRSLIQRIGILIAAAIVTLCLFMVMETSSVHADGMTPKAYKSKISVTTVDYFVYLKMGSRVKKSHKIKVTSSRKSVAKPELDNGRIYIQVKKAGKATITIKNNTTKKTYKTVLKVVKYRNPFKKFYLSGKNRAGKFKTYNYAAFTNNKTSSKVSIKTKAGWKIRKITYCKSVYNEKTEKLANHTKKIKNNSTINLKKSGSSNNVFQFVECEVYNKKNKLTQTFGLDF